MDIGDERKKYLDSLGGGGLPAGEEFTQEEVNYLIDNAPRNATRKEWDSAFDAIIGYFEKVQGIKKQPQHKPYEPLPELKCPNGHILNISERLDGSIDGECPICLTLWRFKKGGAEMEQIPIPPTDNDKPVNLPPFKFPPVEE